MINVPVVVNFDHEKIIGIMSIDETKLPSTPEYVFSIGYRYSSNTEHHLMCISLMWDKEYQKYLELRRNE